MHAGIGSDICTVGDLDMAGQRCGVGHDDLVSELAIVRDVSLSHKQIFVTYTGHATAARGAAMDRNEFANMILFPNLGAGRLATVFQVLWCKADGYERKDPRIVADLSIAIYNDMRFEPDIAAE